MLVKHISTQHNRPTALLNMHVSLWRFLSVLQFSSQSEWSTIQFLIICRGLQTSSPYIILFSIIIVGQKNQTLFVSAILNTSLLSRWSLFVAASCSPRFVWYNIYCVTQIRLLSKYWTTTICYRKREYKVTHAIQKEVTHAIQKEGLQLRIRCVSVNTLFLRYSRTFHI